MSATPRERPELDALAARYGPTAALAVVGTALVLRLPGLFGWWVNPDEGIYYAALTQQRFDRFWAEIFATAHPPLYYLLLRAMGWIGTDLLWLRSLALVSGCAAVGALIVLGRDLVGDSLRGWLTGLLAGLLLAVSPEAIAWSQVIRPYALLVLLLALALWSLVRYLRSPSGRWLLLYAACSSLGAFLHYSAALALGVFVLVVSADGAMRGASRREWRRLAAVQAIPAAVVGALYLLHMRSLMASDNIDFAVEIWLADYLIHEPVDAWLTLVGVHTNLVGTTASVAATLLTLVGLGYAAAEREVVLLFAAAGALLIALACAALELYPFGAGRHSAWLIPFVLPVLAWTVASLLTRPAASPRRAALAAGVVLGGLVLRVPLGAESAAPPLVEHVLREEHVAALSDVLDPQRPPRVVVLSVETYRMLMPLYRDERQAARVSTDSSYLHFRWGTRDVLVLPGLDVAVSRDEMAKPNHLYAGTRRAARELGVALPAAGEPVLFLSGDWRGSVFDLSELARNAGLEAATHSVPGLVAIELDLHAYARALGVSGG